VRLVTPRSAGRLLRDGDDVFHTYSTYQRGLDLLLNTYNYLGLTLSGDRRREIAPRRGFATTIAIPCSSQSLSKARHERRWPKMSGPPPFSDESIV
jgi:Bacterial protein of unknown function (DUF899)